MDPVSMLERQNLYGTAGEERATEGGSRGWSSLGSALVPGAAEAAGEQAEERGELMGAQTISALASARQRVNDNQSRDQAAAALRSPQLQQVLGINGEIGNYAATAAQAGKDPTEITKFIQEVQHLKNSQALSDPNANPAQRQAAAVAEGKTPQHAVGTAGSYTDELTYDPGNPGTGPVHVSPQQSDMNQALIGQRDASAAKAAAGPHTVPGLKYRFKTDDDGNVLMNPDGSPQYEPDPTANEGAVNRRYHEVVGTAFSNLAGETHNIAKMGYNNSTGYTQFGDNKAGLLHTLGNNLGLALSDTDSQQYRTTITNMGRFLGQIENAGRMPPGTLTQQLDNALQNNPGNTEGSRLYNIAIVRQLAETGARAFQATSASPDMKKTVRDSLSDIRQSVPFMPDDVVGFERNGHGSDFSSYLTAHPSKGLSTGIVPTHNAAPQTQPGPAPQSNPNDPLGILGAH